MLLLIFGICSSKSEETTGNIPELESLDSKYKAAVKAQTQKTIKPLEKLFGSYEQRMEILMKNFQKIGNLEKMLAAKKAIESEPQTSNIDAKFEDISKLQEIYISEKKKIIDLNKKADDLLLKKYLTALDALKKKITQEGRIDDALYIDKFIKEINNSNSISEPSEVVVNPDQYSTPISDFLWEMSNGEVILKKYVGENKSNIVVPKEYKGKKITTIGRDAFYPKRDIRSVTLPDSIVTIGNGAFFYCNELRMIKFPKSLKILGDRAFVECKQLREVKLPNGLQKIGRNAFESCENLTSIDIPNSVTFIGKHVFYNCSSLSEVILPESLQIVPEGIFQSSGIKTIVLNENFKTIDSKAFANCNSLESVTINGIQRIEDEAFSNCEEFKLIFNSAPPKLSGENIFSKSFPIIERPIGLSGWGDEWAGFKVNVIR